MTKAKIRHAASLVGGLLIVQLTLSACSLEQSTCGGDAYPVAQIDGPGSYCVAKGEGPDPGYVRYPEGKVPEKVDDTWDMYWMTHYLDKNGREYPAPPEAE